MATTISIRIEGLMDDGDIVRVTAVSDFVADMAKLVDAEVRRLLLLEDAAEEISNIKWGIADLKQGSVSGSIVPLGLPPDREYLARNAGIRVARGLEQVLRGVDAEDAFPSQGHVLRRMARRLKDDARSLSVSAEGVEVRLTPETFGHVAAEPTTSPYIGQIVGTVHSVTVGDKGTSFTVHQEFHRKTVNCSFGEVATFDVIVALLKSQDPAVFRGTIFRDSSGRARKLNQVISIERFAPSLTLEQILYARDHLVDPVLGITDGMTSEEWVRRLRDG